MKINRRRAPSTEISREKKLAGHKLENIVAELINGEVIKGTQKGDIRDGNNNIYSVKSGKKWQILLYSYKRISESNYLNILKPSLDSFPNDYHEYVKDREICIAYKENYLKQHGKNKAKQLSNNDVNLKIGQNLYVNAKINLSKITPKIVITLNDKKNLRNFLNEAMFNEDEVSYLIIQDSTYKKDKCLHVFSKKTVLNTLCRELFSCISKAGRVPIDYNVPAQKVLFQYKKNDGKTKNIIEIEVRADSKSKYRSIRFNMYSRDTLFLLLERNENIIKKQIQKNLFAYEDASDNFN